jgi:hypothetical protein
MNERRECLQSVKGRGYFELSMGGRIILKWISEKKDGRELPGLILTLDWY